MPSKIADHRNEGFTASNAFSEQARETKSAINRQIITPRPAFPTQKEIDAQAGEVKTFNFKRIIPYKELKTMESRIQRDYLTYLLDRYSGLCVGDLHRLMYSKEVSYSGFYARVKELGIDFDKYKSDKRSRLKAMTEFMKELGTPNNPVENPVVDNEPQITHSAQVEIERVELVADIDSLICWLSQYHLEGRWALTLVRKEA